MGTLLNPEDGVFHYYIFQQKLQLYLQGKNYKKDNKKMKEGYILNFRFVSKWKQMINYRIIEEFLIKSGINSKKLETEQKKNINEFIKDKIDLYYYNSMTFMQTSGKNYLPVTDKIIDKNYLETIVNEKIFSSLVYTYHNHKEKINYILKKQILILIFPNYNMIKMIISNLSPFSYEKKIVNLTFKFNIYYYYDEFEKYVKLFEKKSSEEILQFLITYDILEVGFYQLMGQNTFIFQVFNEEQYIKENKQKQIKQIIKAPNDINYSLIQRPSFRGLDNVGATCYMNATLQCLANIRPITEALLKQKKYNDIYNNSNICRLTIEYCQVLIGLFCDNSNIGSYNPEQFKITIGELNPLFQGVQANDSKDLIIFLLENLNNELVKLHNKKHNIKETQNVFNPNIDPTNESMVFNEFQKEFSKNYCSTVGFNLCGIQKNIFICKNCGGISNNFNVFNFLIFGLEAISKYFNLSFNNSKIPTINFDHCFKFLFKQEVFEQIYCQRCRMTGNSIYQEGLYMLPNYLIIVLNRGKGNVFKCNVDIPLNFNSSNYSLKTVNNIYELVGVVSHFGESGMGGHFIAFCKHSIDSKWRCYNDSTVVECQNDYLTKGTPYILFYRNTSAINKNQNNNINNIPIQNFNNMNFNNMQQQNMNMNNMNLHANMFMVQNNAQVMNMMNPNINLNFQNNMNMINNQNIPINNMNFGFNRINK